MKKVLILSSSPRKGGNSDILCDQFAKGAQTSRHQVEKIYVCDQTIHYCIGCGACQRNGGTCVQKDDMELILDKMIHADVIVMATPVYFYNMNGQLKTLIDRTTPRYLEISNKDFYIIMAAAEDNQEIMSHVLESFAGFFDCLKNARFAGVVYGLDAYEVGEIKTKVAMQEAYEMGKQV